MQSNPMFCCSIGSVSDCLMDVSLSKLSTYIGPTPLLHDHLQNKHGHSHYVDEIASSSVLLKLMNASCHQLPII